MIWCDDVARMYPEEFKLEGGCCISCHEEENEGYELAMGKTLQREDYCVCCAAERALQAGEKVSIP